MKTVEEIIKPFIAQPSVQTEGAFGVKSDNTYNMLKSARANKADILRAIVTCNPELRNPENASLMGEVIARVEQEMAPSASTNNYSMQK